MMLAAFFGVLFIILGIALCIVSFALLVMGGDVGLGIGGLFFGILFVLAGVAMVRKSSEEESSPVQTTQSPTRQNPTQIRCPHCGSPARIRGDNLWECGWCGDFGSLR